MVAMMRSFLAGNAVIHFESLHAMNIPEIKSPQLNLSQDSGRPPLMVDMERFFEFSFWMAEELLDLVAQSQFQTENQQVNHGDLRLHKSDRFTN
jgi:hypothetical protein